MGIQTLQIPHRLPQALLLVSRKLRPKVGRVFSVAPMNDREIDIVCYPHGF